MTAADTAPFTVTVAVLGTSTALSDAGLAPPQVLTALQAPSAAVEILQEHSIGVNMVMKSSANEHSPPAVAMIGHLLKKNGIANSVNRPASPPFPTTVKSDPSTVVYVFSPL